MPLLLAGDAKAHEAAVVVVLQNAVAHALPAGNILGGADVVGVVGNLSDEDHPGLPAARVAGDTVPPDVVAVLLQFADDPLVQPSARPVPKGDGGLELLHVVALQPQRQGIEQKTGIRLPGMPLGEGDIAVAHRLAAAVDGGKVRPLHAADQLGPDLGINDPVEIQAVLGVVVEGRGHAHLRGLEPRHIEQVVQMVVVVAKEKVGVPYVRERPIVERGGAPDVLKHRAHPASALVAVLFIEKSAIALQGFLRADAQQAYGLFFAVGQAVPAAELPGKVLLMHAVAVGGHGVVFQVDDELVLWHGPHPGRLLGVVPGIPIHLIAAQRRAGGHG